MAGAQEIQTQAIAFANDAKEEMERFAMAASGLVNRGIFPGSNSATYSSDGSIPTIYRAFGNIPPIGNDFVPGYTGGVLPMPADISIAPATVASPTRPSMSSIALADIGPVPEFDMVMPVLNMPVSPSTALPAAPGAAPGLTTPSLPNAPTITLPSAPTFAPIALPDAPNIDLPVFDATLPVDTITAPTESFAFSEQPYQSALSDALKVKLMTDLLNGGYGIEPADEDALWARTREREMRAGETGVQEAVRQMAGRGFRLPQGSLNGLIAAAQQSAAEKNSSASRDIALKRADMYVENRKFTIEQTREVEATLINYMGGLAERALNAARASVELGIAVFNARVAKFSLQLDIYKTRASVYETMIRGALMHLEAYKTQMEGAQLAVSVQRGYIDIYRSQLDGANALIGLYTSELGAARIVMDIDRAKLDAFKVQVEAYTAQVGAKSAEFGVFESQIRGEMAKVSAFSASADAYGKMVGAYRAKAETTDLLFRGKLANEQLKLDTYRLDLARYSADLEKSKTAVDQTVAIYDADVKKFSLSADIAIKTSEQNMTFAKANADLALAKVRLAGDLATSYANVASTTTLGVRRISEGLTGAFGSLGASALSSAIGITSMAESS